VRRASELLREVFRCPNDVAAFVLKGDLSDTPGYFRFGDDVICYGRCSSGEPAQSPRSQLHDALSHVLTDWSSVHLPFDAPQIVDDLRQERYIADHNGGGPPLPGNSVIRSMYYAARPLMKVAFRRRLQKLYFRHRENSPFPRWPVDVSVENISERLLVFAMKSRNIDRLPFIWFWPKGLPSCTIVSHDVETEAGLRFCGDLMDLNDSFGIKTSFQIVPEERYAIPDVLIQSFHERGFEINIHDLNHDGHLFRNRMEFLARAKRINSYARQYGAQGFRSAVLYRNVDWLGALDIAYDMSLPNVAHFDPQKGGCCTVRPFFIGNILELPLTTTQDYTLFHILEDYSVTLWKEQISLIQKKNGLISFIIHPDYCIEPDARRVYAELLQLLDQMRTKQETWIALPREVAAWWRQRSEMELVFAGGSWRIEGEGSERATLAYAVLHENGLRYEFDSCEQAQAG